MGSADTPVLSGLGSFRDPERAPVSENSTNRPWDSTRAGPAARLPGSETPTLLAALRNEPLSLAGTSLLSICCQLPSLSLKLTGLAKNCVSMYPSSVVEVLELSVRRPTTSASFLDESGPRTLGPFPAPSGIGPPTGVRLIFPGENLTAAGGRLSLAASAPGGTAKSAPRAEVLRANERVRRRHLFNWNLPAFLSAEGP